MLRKTSVRKNFRFALAAAVVSAASLLCWTPSRAQDWIGPTPMDYANMNMNFTNTLINNAVIENMTRGGSSGASRGGRSSSATRKSTASPASFAYTATPAQRAAYRDAYVASLAKSNPTLAASLRTQLQKYDYNTIYNGFLSGTDLTSNNLVDAFTAYAVMGWMIVNGQTSDPPLAHIAGVRRQWAIALGRTGFATNAEERRRTAEELKIKMVLLNAGWKDAVKTGTGAAYATTVDGLFQSQMKLKLRGMSLSAAGLKSRG